MTTSTIAETLVLLTTAEVGTLLRTPQSTLRWWRHTGTGPACFKLGRRVVYRKGAVEDWVAECEANEPSR